MQSQILPLPKSKIEIKITVSPEELEKEYQKAWKKTAESVKLPGFRTGKAPQTLLEERINPASVWQTTLDNLLPKLYSETVQKHNLFPLFSPQVDIVNLDQFFESIGAEKGQTKKPLELKVKFAVTVRPEAKVGEYQKIRIEKPAVSISQQEVEDVVQKAFREWKEKKGSEEEKTDIGAKGIVTAKSLSEAERKAREKQKEDKEKLARFEKSTPDDEWAQILGAKSLTDLKRDIRESMLKNKKWQQEREFEEKIFEELLKISEIEIPEEMINEDLAKREESLRDQLKSQAIRWEDYLAAQKISEQDLRNHWQEDSEKSLKNEFILDKIADLEQIIISDKEIEEETNKIKDKNVRQKLASERQKRYIRFTLRRQKVIERVKQIAQGKGG